MKSIYKWLKIILLILFIQITILSKVSFADYSDEDDNDESDGEPTSFATTENDNEVTTLSRSTTSSRGTTSLDKSTEKSDNEFTTVNSIEEEEDDDSDSETTSFTTTEDNKKVTTSSKESTKISDDDDNIEENESDSESFTVNSKVQGGESTTKSNSGNISFSNSKNEDMLTTESDDNEIDEESNDKDGENKDNKDNDTNDEDDNDEDKEDDEEELDNSNATEKASGKSSYFRSAVSGLSGLKNRMSSKNNETSFFGSLREEIGGKASRISNSVVVADKKQLAFLQKYYKVLAKKRAKDGDQDVTLKAFKGGGVDQSAAEQKDTDSFFSKVGNYFGKSCFPDIGCFSAAEYFDSSNRPLPMLPLSPDTIKPMFHLYTVDSRSVPRNYSYNVTSTTLRYSGYNPKLKTVFIVHGYQSGYALWMENLKDLVLYQSDDQYNVVVVVWERGARVPIYNLAATNTRVVGACIGFFITTLCNTFNITNNMFHLIGHSLGAHTVGYAGKRLHSPKVARITALDPAGVGFHFKNPKMRLDSGDATVVMAIHTDAALTYTEGFGTADTLATYDFFPNGGIWQPGCPRSQSVYQKLGSITSGEDITCSHSRACLILNDLDKPEDDCSAVAYYCPTYSMFLEGRCADCRDNKCELMGIDPRHWERLTARESNHTVNRRYYINTSHKEEYCLQHFQFGLHTTKDSDACTGMLYFKMKIKTGEKGANATRVIDYHRQMTRTTQNKIHTFLINFDIYVDKIFELELRWVRFDGSDFNKLNRGYKLKIPYIEVNFMSSMDEKYRKDRSTILCATDPKGKVIANKGRHLYKECDEELDERANEMAAEDLVPLEVKEDIHSVDYKRQHRVFHKIAGTRIQEKIQKNEQVN